MVEGLEGIFFFILILIETFKASFWHFPELWVLWVSSLILTGRDIFKKGFSFGSLIGLLVFFGVLGHVIILFGFAITSWTTIVTENLISPTLFSILRVFSMASGYSLTRRYMTSSYLHKEKVDMTKPIIRFFFEFINICGSIAGFLVVITAIILYAAISR